MSTSANFSRRMSEWACGLAAGLIAASALILPATAWAQQNPYNGLTNGGYRAAEALLKSTCFNNGVTSCTVCGQTIDINNNNATIPSLGLTVPYNVTPPQATQLLNTLGAFCTSGAGDGILSTGGSQSVQNAQVENISRVFARHGGGGADYSGGGIVEAAAGTYGGSIPLTYGVPLSKDTSFSSVGYVSYANQGTINQGAVSGSPAYAWQVRDNEGNRLIGVAAYVPLSIAFTSVQGASNVATTWGAGAGAIATGTVTYRAMLITYGAGAAFRVVTNANFALPLSILGRADQPLEFISPYLKGFVAVSYGNDYLNAGTEGWVLGTGAAFGKYEIGYRGYYGSGTVAHTLGFSIRKELIGGEVLERAPTEEENKPTGPTIPISPTIIFPGLPPLPPPPEVPQLPPACTTDSDCPGDQICEEARCLSPL